ncbi:MAG TPA: hypothetical protein DEF72_01595 [Gammaproteobacteria bacterium]|nr:hypothetical protein [Gammaproteobacteria bacterium]
MRLGIIGAGQSACTLATELIRGQFDGEILIFNGESHRPYQRPPLSKTSLKTRTDTNTLLLLPEPIENHASIQWIREWVNFIQPDSGEIHTQQARYHVDQIVLATGTRAKRLTIKGLPPETQHVVRTLDDTERLKQHIDHAKNITIIGAGFLAFELAATLDHPDRVIRIVAKGDRLLPQVSLKTADRLVGSSPASTAVDVRIESYDTASKTLTTNHGPVPADLVIIAAGAVPNTEIAMRCGLGTADGITTDAFMQTPHPKVSAIGEVSLHPQPHLGRPERVESISEANESATTCARRLLGHSEPFAAIPWFWSDQGQLKLQIAGLCARSDDETCLISTKAVSLVVRHRGDRVTAVEAINAPKEFMSARRLFERGTVSLSALSKAGSVFDLLQSSRS